MNDTTGPGTGPDPGAELDARLIARLDALTPPVVAAERERIRALFDKWITVALAEPNGHPPEAWKVAFADLISDRPQFVIASTDRDAPSPAVEGLQAPRPVVRVLPDREGQHETAPAVTPGQAAYEASIGIIRDDFDGPPWAWETLPPRHRKVFDVAGEAAIEASGLRAELNEAKGHLARCAEDISDLEWQILRGWPKCPDGCGCRLGTEDADARECGCDGPCTMECRENDYPDAPSYRDLAVKDALAEVEALRYAVERITGESAGMRSTA